MSRSDDASDRPGWKYPPTFSSQLIQHCEEGCIPPEVFMDAHKLLYGECRRRYVYVNPRSHARVFAAGREAVHREAMPVQSTSGNSKQLHIAQECRATQRQCAPIVNVTLSDLDRGVSDQPPRLSVMLLGLSVLTGLAPECIKPVDWLPCSMFTLPWSYRLGDNPLFHDGTLMAMDAASAAAVVALGPREGDRVLELCCAPGMKLGLIAGAVAGDARWADGCARRGGGVVVGVDVNIPRLYVTRSNLKKQQQSGGTRVAEAAFAGRTAKDARLKNNACSSAEVVADATVVETFSVDGPAALPVCLFAGDGRFFTMGNAAKSLDPTGTTVDPGTGLSARERRRLRCWEGAEPNTGAKRKRRASPLPVTPALSPSAASAAPLVVYATTPSRDAVRCWLRTANHGIPNSNGAEELLFDRVLVDAECSHDGSIAHLLLEEQRKAPAAPNAMAHEDTDATTPSPTVVSPLPRGRGIDNAYRMQRLNLGIAETPAAPQSSGDLRDSCWPLGPTSAASLFALQSRLLDNGYRQLRPGGTLVYATCSYSYLQNEYLVRRFLERVNAGIDERKAAEVPLVASSDHNGWAAPERGVLAVLVSTFSYEHELLNGGKRDEAASSLSFESEDQRRALQSKLDEHAHDYGILHEGTRRYESGAAGEGVKEPPLTSNVGSRLWPRVFHTSFLYVAKIWKKPLTAIDVVQQDS